MSKQNYNLIVNNIDKIKGKFPGVIGVAADLVKYDKKYTQIVYNLLGRTVIVDNMDTGIALAKENKYGFRIVTVQGDIINASGAITGGSVAQKTVNILGRGREIEKLQKYFLLNFDILLFPDCMESSSIFHRILSSQQP